MATKTKGTKITKRTKPVEIENDEPESAEDLEQDEPTTAKEATSKRTAKAKKEAKPKAVKLTPAQRLAARQDKLAAQRANGGLARNAAGRPTAEGLTCLCGCGQDTVTEQAFFISGHDAKLRKSILDLPEEDRTIDALPTIIRPFMVEGEMTIAGLAVEAGEIVDMKATA
jgi:hypothetical protein